MRYILLLLINLTFLIKGVGQNYLRLDTTSIITSDTKGDSWGVSWVDYNSYGFVDLFVTDKNPEAPNRLYKNINGEGFERILNAGELITDKVSSVSDIDNDDDIDVFISNNQGSGDFIYLNNGDGTFEKINGGSITSQGVHSHAAAWGDYDNDGDLDLFVTNASDQDNFFYENTTIDSRNNRKRKVKFTKITDKIIVNDKGHSHGSAWIDFDNDGYLDLFVSNSNGQDNYLYKNNGDKTFTKIEDAFKDVGGNSFGTALADFDNDGDLDNYIANHSNGRNFFYINERGNEKNYFNVSLVGSNANSTAVSAIVKVLTSKDENQKKGNDKDEVITGTWQMRHVSALTSGIGSMDHEMLHFGIGSNETVDSVIIDWPSEETNKKRSRYGNHNSNEEVEIIEEEHVSVEEYPTSGIIDVSWAFPNPTQDDLNLVYEANEIHTIKVIIQDVGSRHSMINYYNLQNGRNQFYYNVEEFSQGIHFITIINEAENIVKTIQFVKVQN